MMSAIKLGTFLATLALCVAGNRIEVAYAESHGQNTTYTVTLPIVMNIAHWRAPFGIESTNNHISTPEISGHGAQSGAGWIRLNSVSWRAVQADRGASYNWGALAQFEQELLAAQHLGLMPIVVVDDSPEWATINIPIPTSCGAIKTDSFGDYARFLSALILRYKDHPFRVRHWELGNEVDVDPSLVPPDAVFGCWGDRNDYYYGGEHYGNMLRAVAPAIRAADPNAVILLGGLMVASTNTANNDIGKPERFLHGILRAGAAPYFDVVAYHGHAAFYGDAHVDYSKPAGEWEAGGKPAFIRSILATYGVDKPLYLDEASLGCPEYLPQYCARPGPEFYQAQADYAPKMLSRNLKDGVQVVVWYTLEDSGWRSSGLLDGTASPKPVYDSVRTFNESIKHAVLPPQAVTYSSEVEAFRFLNRPHLVDVIWSLDAVPDTITVPQSKFVAAFGRDGEPVPATVTDGNVLIRVGFSPVYVHRNP